jgi:putative transcriptional regulator
MRLRKAGIVLPAATIVMLRIAPHAEQRGKPDPEVPTVGKLLVASRGLTDPNFVYSVVILFDVRKDGAAGLILNRETDLTLGKLLPSLAVGKVRDVRAFAGGPVAPASVFALLKRSKPGSQRVLDDVYLVNTREGLASIFSDGVDADYFRAYLGYAGWGEGQLEREVAAGAWRVIDGDATVVFDPDPDRVWEKQLQRTVTRFASLRIFNSPSRRKEPSSR